MSDFLQPGPFLKCDIRQCLAAAERLVSQGSDALWNVYLLKRCVRKSLIFDGKKSFRQRHAHQTATIIKRAAPYGFQSRGERDFLHC